MQNFEQLGKAESASQENNSSKDETMMQISASNLPIIAMPKLPDNYKELVELNLSHSQLHQLPAEIGELRSLTSLDASSNNLSELPEELGQLGSLQYLNLMSNRIRQLPESIGQLHCLCRLGLKGNVLEQLPASFGGLSSLVELFLTDNQLQTLPASISGCTSLVKLQASFNRLTALPPEIGSLPRLELFRVAVNCLTHVPDEVSRLDNLAWLSLGGNPVCRQAAPPLPHIRPFQLHQLQVGQGLGDGASGDVFAADLGGKHVAVKVFRADASPDGHSADEIAVSCTLDHPCLIRVLGLLEDPKGLVVDRVFGVPLAEKPNLDSLLRCRWEKGRTFSPAFVRQVAADVAGALAFLHARHIAHGDVYAHNVLADESGASVLCDYGASFFYHPGAVPYEAHEVRAFGLMLSDMVARIPPEEAATEAAGLLASIRDDCLATPWRLRPRFADLQPRLAPAS